MTNKADISIVIVNYNVRDFIIRCLESIFSSDGNFSLEVIVVDNASVDGSISAIKAGFPDVKIIENMENTGFGSANNQGFDCSTAPYTLILNPDTILSTDTLLKCHAFMQANGQVGAVGAQMVDGAGNFLPESKRGLPGLWNSFTKMTSIYRLFPKSSLLNGYYLGHLDKDITSEIEVLTGAFMFVRSELLHKLGGFDESFFMYGEDIDLSKRILDEGFKIVYLPSAKIVHFKGESTKKSSIKYHKSFYAAMSIYVHKHLHQKSFLFSTFLNLTILLLGLGNFLANFLKSIWKPIIGLLLTMTCYWFAHVLWSYLYFHDANYFEAHNIYITSISSAIIIVLAIWFFGWYDKFPKQKYLTTGMIIAGMVILMLYAIVPASYRNSRAVIFLGLAISYVVLTLWQNASSLIKGKAKRVKKILLVANKERETLLVETLESTSNCEVIGLVSPQKELGSSAYINDVSNLAEVINTLKPDEVIFDAGSMKMNQIMDLMNFPASSIHYKIAGSQSKSIIGSNSSKNQGEIYSVESSYNLAKPLYQRIKRSLDVILSFSLMFLVVFTKKLKYRQLWEVLIGQLTFVTYTNSAINGNMQLPMLQGGIFNTAFLIGEVLGGNFVDTVEKADICYAKYYNPVQDLKIVLSNLTKK